MPRKAYIREIEVPATTATIKLTRLHMNVIAAIADESFATQNEMADDLGMSHGSFHIAVSRLCQRVGVLHSPRKSALLDHAEHAGSDRPNRRN